jgi:molybdenum cofactor cytidylyltransferase
MQLIDALRLEYPARVAFVGAGGKTSAIFQLARQLPPPVIITTTTHLGKNQLDMADANFELDDFDHVKDALKRLQAVNVFFRKIDDPLRVGPLEPVLLSKLNDSAEEKGISLLVEADGSRGLPAKAPAGHEPVIPDWIETTVVVAGLTALGNPLDEQTVHRPEKFCALSGLDPGAMITPAAITNVLLHPMGGLKNIPPLSRKVVLLNQADTYILQAVAQSMSSQLLTQYERVLVAHLQPTRLDNLDITSAEAENPVVAAFVRIGAVILAAGVSNRLGQPKQLLLWKNEPFIRKVAKTAIDAGLDPVIVVTGAVKTEIQKVLSDLPLLWKHNEEWAEGQSSSIKVGLKALPAGCGAVIFLLADQPQIPADLLKLLASRHHQTLAKIIAPEVEGRRANPVLFDQTTFRDLLSLTGDIGGRGIFSKYKVHYVPWNDPAILVDVDSPEDYNRLLSL